MRNVLEVHGLTKSYSNFSLNEVSFSVPEGCITGFIGTNGSGKTTTIRSILNLAKISSGEITLFGMNMQKSEKEIKNRVGIVMDEGYFYEGLTMNEMKSIIAPSYSEWDNSAYKNYMDMFSLDPNQNISTLSRGMKTKFALVLALSHKPELLIMDEPTSGLDPLIRNDLLDIIAEFMENGGKGVFFSTHITSDLDKIADTLIMIDNGTIIFSKSKDELLENYRHVKGDNGLINDHTRQLFLYLNSTQYGFTGITDDYAAAKKVMPDALFEKASIEEIMLAYIRGGHANA